MDKNNNKITSHHNFYAVMDFYPEKELSLSDNEHSFVNTSNQFFTNGVKALEVYLNSPRDYTQLATGETLEELKQDMINVTKSINNIIKEYDVSNH